MYRKILLALAPSPGNVGAVAAAVRLAARHQADLSLVLVRTDSGPPLGRERAEAFIATHFPDLRHCRLEMAEGPLREGILRAARNDAADLIVVGVCEGPGTGRESPAGLVRFLSEGARCPVLSVPETGRSPS